jgi:peptide/nickel transport system permease protein
MGTVLAKRLLSVIPTLLIASIVVFGLVQLVPGDPAVASAGENATVEVIAARRAALGLDRPLLVQYWDWLMRVLHGDLGNSFLSGEPITRAIARTLPVTVSVVATALIISLLLGIPGGILAAWNARGPVDRVVSTASSVGIAMPSFWLALILVSVLAIQHQVFPATGFVPLTENVGQGIRHLILPAFAMGVVGAAEVARQLRSAMISALASDFVRTLYAKGLSRRLIIVHALKNSSVPLLTIGGLQVNRFLGATVVIEAVFGLSGLGQLIMNATLQKDFVVIQGVVLVMAVLVIATNIIVDFAYRLVDPRIR